MSRKTWFWLCIAAAVIWCQGGFVQADPYAPYRSVAHLKVGGVSGSGTAIASQGGLVCVLTCRHVAGTQGNRVVLTWPWLPGQPTSSGQTAVTLNGGGFDTDLAIVVCRDPGGVPVRRVKSFDQNAGPWTAAGFRSGYMRVAGPSPLMIQRSDGLLVMPKAFIGGQSGGPLFDRFGNVVGVVVASDRVSVGLSADGDNLRRILHLAFTSYPMGE